MGVDVSVGMLVRVVVGISVCVGSTPGDVKVLATRVCSGVGTAVDLPQAESKLRTAKIMSKWFFLSMGISLR